MINRKIIFGRTWWLTLYHLLRMCPTRFESGGSRRKMNLGGPLHGRCPNSSCKPDLRMQKNCPTKIKGFGKMSEYSQIEGRSKDRHHEVELEVIGQVPRPPHALEEKRLSRGLKMAYETLGT